MSNKPIIDPKLLFAKHKDINKMKKKLSVKTKVSSLNRALFGGIPAGAICEIYGANGNGKSVCSALILSSIAEQGNLGAVIDVENSIDTEWYEALGVDWESTPRFEISFIQEAAKRSYEIIRDFRELKNKKQIPEGTLLYLIIDTVACLLNKNTDNDELEGKTFKEMTMLLQDWLITLLSRIGDDVSIILINQERDNVKAKNKYDPEKTSWGANALKHNCSVRIRFNLRSKDYDNSSNDKVVGYRLRFIVEKSKNVGINEQVGYIYIANGKGQCKIGFDEVKEAVEEAITVEYIEKEGSKYKVPFLDKDFSGVYRLYSHFRTNPDDLKQLKDILDKQLEDLINETKFKKEEVVIEKQEETEEKSEVKITRRRAKNQ